MNQLQNKSFEEALVRYREKWDKIKDPCVVYDFPIPDVSCKELFLKRVSEHPDKTYVISRGAKMSYVECNTLAAKIANGFLAKGLKKGDRVITYPLAYSVHPQDRRRHGRNSRRRCIHRMWSDHSSRGRRKGHVDHHHLRRRRSLRCRPYGIPRREHLARRHSRTYPRTHHEQSLDIHPLPVHHHLSASFRYRLPVLLHGSHDSNLRLAA